MLSRDVLRPGEGARPEEGHVERPRSRGHGVGGRGRQRQARLGQQVAVPDLGWSPAGLRPSSVTGEGGRGGRRTGEGDRGRHRFRGDDGRQEPEGSCGEEATAKDQRRGGSGRRHDGDPGGIRTRDLHLERVACWASAPQGRGTVWEKSPRVKGVAYTPPSVPASRQRLEMGSGPAFSWRAASRGCQAARGRSRRLGAGRAIGRVYRRERLSIASSAWKMSPLPRRRSAAARTRTSITMSSSRCHPTGGYGQDGSSDSCFFRWGRVGPPGAVLRC
jgi:hypothetical protein